MTDFERLLKAVTRDGTLGPADLWGWAAVLEDRQGYLGVNVVVRYSEPDHVAWLRGLADALELHERGMKGKEGRDGQ